jgi:hypothetical protein
VVLFTESSLHIESFSFMLHSISVKSLSNDDHIYLTMKVHYISNGNSVEKRHHLFHET